MATRQRLRDPVHRTVLVGVAVVGFAGAVALVGAGSVGPHRRGGSAAADTTVTTLATLIGLAALGFTVFVVRRTRRPPPPVGERTGSVAPFLVQPIIAPLLSTLLLLLAYALLIGPCMSDNNKVEPLEPARREAPSTTAPLADSSDREEGKPSWSVVTGIVLGVAGTALALVAARNRRRPEPEPDEPGLEEEISLSLNDLDSLEDDPDHRRVVIRTYARMERALGRSGVSREPWESPQEFLRRALANLGAGAAAAGRLTDLFEQARFSTHPVDETMRAAAATSLRVVRDQISGDMATPRMNP